jgi:serine/threonine protein kinase
MPSCPNPRCQSVYPAGTTQCTNPRCRCLLPEAIVAGRYRIETLIGIGGMGAVYRTSDTFEGEQVALKILSAASAAADLETASERFRREARYAHQLRHPNIVSVLNFGQDGPLLYITMPLITGGTLKTLLKAERPLPTELAQRYLNELAQAIDAIHAHPQQIVHRDLKPSNLLIHQDDQRLVVADFGIARAMQMEKPLTQRGWTLGTEHYTAPEQEQGKSEPASDIYAMGVVCYQMFTGLLPFQAVVKYHATELPGPSTLNTTLPLAVDRAILKAIEIEPEKRYSSGQEFADALNDALAGHDIWSEPTIIDNAAVTMLPIGQDNTVIRMIIPENPCGQCGHENRLSSRFCRYCGHSLSDTSPLVHDLCQVGYLSDSGRVSPQNEDMLLIMQGLCSNLAPPPRPFGLFAVADGLHVQPGQPAKSHEASRLAIETVADILQPLITTAATTASMHSYNTSSGPQPSSGTQHHAILPANVLLEQWIRDAVRQANQVIYHCNADYDATMASTLTLALLYKHQLFVSSIGDGRAYHYNAKKELRCLTKDHTIAASLVEADLLQAHEVAQSPKRNQLYRYLGQNYIIPIDFFQCATEPNDLILLCTNGLWHMLSDQQIKALIEQEEDPQKLAFMLVEAANSAGGKGNTSVIAIRVQ